jgi:hypothetical protein
VKPRVLIRAYGQGSLVMAGNVNVAGVLNVMSEILGQSTLRVCSFVRLGSPVSAVGLINMELQLMVVACSANGLVLLALRLCCEICGGLTIGSALSVREFSHYGSSLPVAGLVRLGSVGAFSTTAELTVSSSLSMRSFARFGSTCSVSDEISLSVSFLARAAVNVPSSGQVLATQGLDILASRLGSSLSGVLALDAHTFEALTSL